jgi:carboxymethylenebutenolidase
MPNLFNSTKMALLCVTVLLTTQSHAQNSCCFTSISMQHAMLAQNKSFVNAHLEPKALALENPIGRMVEMTTIDGFPAKAYYIPSKKRSKKFIIIFHEWWGLNNHIKKEAEHIYNRFKDINVIAVDMYDGKIGNTREEAAKLLMGADEKRLRHIIQAALDYAGKDADIATYGWCAGGAWSLQASIAGGANIKGCVMYYGMPEKNVTTLKTLNCEVLGIFAEQDKFITPEVVKTFEQNMKEAGKQIILYQYAADHAFANPSNPGFNEEATKDAFIKATYYLKKKLSLKLKK